MQFRETHAETDVCATNIKSVELELSEDSELEDIRTSSRMLFETVLSQCFCLFSICRNRTKLLEVGWHHMST